MNFAVVWKHIFCLPWASSICVPLHTPLDLKDRPTVKKLQIAFLQIPDSFNIRLQKSKGNNSPTCGCKMTEGHYCKVFYIHGIWKRCLMIQRLEIWLRAFEMLFFHNNIMKMHISAASVLSLSPITTAHTFIPSFNSPIWWMPTSLSEFINYIA